MLNVTMSLTFTLSFLFICASIGTMAYPFPSTSKPFEEFVLNHRKQQICLFPPRYVFDNYLDQNFRYKKCMEQGTTLTNKFCDGIMKLSTQVCSLLDERQNLFSSVFKAQAPVIQLPEDPEGPPPELDKMQKEVSAMCSTKEFGRLAAESQADCMKECVNQGSFFICQLYDLMIKNEQKQFNLNFQNVADFSALDSYVLQVPRHAFPPAGIIIGQNYPLHACMNPAAETKPLCDAVRLAAIMISNTSAVKLDGFQFRKIMEADTDNGTGLCGKIGALKVAPKEAYVWKKLADQAKCIEVCSGERLDVCKALYHGLITIPENGADISGNQGATQIKVTAVDGANNGINPEKLLSAGTDTGAGLQPNTGTDNGAGLQPNTGTNNGAGLQPNAGTDNGAALQPNAGTNNGAALQPNAGTDNGAALQPNAGTNNGAGLQPNTGTNNGAALQPNAGTDNGAGLQPNAGTNNGAGLQPNTGTNNGAALQPNTGTNNGAALQPNAGTNNGAALQPNAGGAGLQPNAGTDSGAALQPNAGTDNGAALQPNAGTDNGAALQPNVGTDNGAALQPNVGTNNGAGLQPNVGTDNGAALQPNVGTDNGAALQPNVGTNNGAGLQPNAGTDNGAALQPNAGTDNGAALQPNAGTDNGAALQPNAGTDNGAALQPNAGTDNGAALQPNAGTDNGAGLQPNAGTDNGAALQPNVGTDNGAGLQPNVGTDNGAALQPNAGTDNGASLQPNVGTDNGAALQPNAGTDNGAALQPNVGTDNGAEPLAPGAACDPNSGAKCVVNAVCEAGEDGKSVCKCSQGYSEEETTKTCVTPGTSTTWFSTTEPNGDYTDDTSDDSNEFEFNPARGQLDNNEQKDQPVKDTQETRMKSPMEEETKGTSFISYFLVATVLVVAGYLIFHNKQKIIALVVEGKNGGRNGSRRPNSKEYRQLKTDDVMPSLEKSAASKDYVF